MTFKGGFSNDDAPFYLLRKQTFLRNLGLGFGPMFRLQSWYVYRNISLIMTRHTENLNFIDQSVKQAWYYFDGLLAV